MTENPNQTTALARRNDMTPSTLAEAKDFATMVASSALVPDALRGKPQDVFVTIVTGHELGLSPMQAMRSIHIVKGKPVLSADLMVALVKRRRDVCEYFRLVESTPVKAVYETRRAGDAEPTTLTWTLEMAYTARLDGDNWKKHPGAMLRARCAAALARAVYPDLVLGVYEESEGEEMDKVDRRAVVDALDVESSPVIEAPRRTESNSPSVAAVGVENLRTADMPVTGGEAPVDPVKVEFEAVNQLLHSAAGYGGDEGKESRRQWWAAALGYKDPTKAWNPFKAFGRADDSVRRNALVKATALVHPEDNAMPGWAGDPVAPDEAEAIKRGERVVGADDE